MPGTSRQVSIGQPGAASLSTASPRLPSASQPAGSREQGGCQHFLTAPSPGLTGWEDWARPAQHGHEVSTPGSTETGQRLRRPQRPKYRAVPTAHSHRLPTGVALPPPRERQAEAAPNPLQESEPRDRRAVCSQPEGSHCPLDRNPGCGVSVCRSSSCLNASRDGALTTLKAALRLQGSQRSWGAGT